MKVKKILKHCKPKTHIAVFDEICGFEDYDSKSEVPASIREMEVIQISVQQFCFRTTPSLELIVKGRII